MFVFAATGGAGKGVWVQAEAVVPEVPGDARFGHQGLLEGQRNPFMGDFFPFFIKNNKQARIYSCETRLSCIFFPICDGDTEMMNSVVQVATCAKTTN